MQADASLLERWSRQPHVIVATTDDPAAERAFEGAVWAEELAAQSDASRYWIAELGERAIGAMQISDPELEPTHYWGEVAANQRAIDIWIGEPDALGQGYGEQMMRLALRHCFEQPAVTAILIDPLASNTRSHRFYERLGFERVERRAFGDDDCIVYRLTREAWCARLT